MRTARVFLKALVVGFFPAMGWLIPASLWGQALPVASALHADARVAQLTHQAQSLFETPSRFGEAGTLLDEAGRLLPVEDPAAVDLLVQAARLEYSVGDLVRARSAMRAAAWRALGNGRVVAAAHAYADAALIALAQGDMEGARELVGIVQVLRQWPGLNARERREIARRIA